VNYRITGEGELIHDAVRSVPSDFASGLFECLDSAPPFFNDILF
jgi:hypothetical protein